MYRIFVKFFVCLCRLSVLGHHVEAKSVPYESLSARSEPNSNTNPFDQFEEEVFAEDGVVEDVIAVDYKSL